MLSSSRRLQLLAAIRHEAGHILAALVVLVRIRWSIALPDGSGATDFVQPLEAFANKRLMALWNYVNAGPQNVAARWVALQQSFPAERPPTSQELFVAYRAIAILMAGTIAEGNVLPYHRGNAFVDVDDATKVWSVVTLLNIPVAEVLDLEAHLQGIIAAHLPVVIAAFSRQPDGRHLYVHTGAIERAVAENPGTEHRLLPRAPRTPPLLGVIAVGALVCFGLHRLRRSA